jgi:hypothetical protein
MIDSALLSAIAALMGSLIGGTATLTASWLTQRLQLRIQATVHEAAKRESLYAEFIIEASRRLCHVNERWAGRGVGSVRLMLPRRRFAIALPLRL